MKYIFWKYRFVIPLLILSLIFVTIWFHNGLIHGGGDEELLFVNAKHAVDVSSSVWLGKSTGAAVLYWLSRFTFVYFIYILNVFLFIPNIVLQEATFFLLLVVGTVSTYFLTKKLSEQNTYSEYIGFVAGIFYLLNPFSMSQVWGRGEYAQFFGFALLPLSLLIFVYGLKEQKYIYAFIFVFVSLIFSNSYGFVTFIAIQWFVFLLFGILEVIVEKNKMKTASYVLKFFSLCFLLWIFVQSWWLLPLVLSGSSLLGADLGSASGNLGSLIGVSQFYPFPIIIRLLQSFYFFSPTSYSPVYAILRYQAISFIPVVFLFVGVLVSLWKKWNSGFLFFLVTFFIGLIVSLGSNPPFGQIFVWFFQHILVLQAFRNPYEKFGLVYALGYSQLMAVGVVSVYAIFTQRWKLFKVFVPIIFCGIFLAWNMYLWPMWTGKVVQNPDGKIGISVPQYYSELETWLQDHNDGFRVMMTPLWGGDSGEYDWNGTTYQGVDPMMFLLSAETISNTGDVPEYFSFAQNIRKYMQQIDIHPALELLRVKYLINRNDASNISENEKEEYISMTHTNYPLAPSDSETVCENQHVSVPQNTQAEILCEVPIQKSNWGDIRYFHLTLSTDVPSYVEVVVRDANDTKLGWDGRGDPDYLVNSTTRTVMFPLQSPNVPNKMMDFSHIHYVEIYAHPIHNFGGSVQTITLQNIGLNSGVKTDIDEFHFLTHIGKLDIYAPNHFVVSPEFGTLSRIQPVGNFQELFQQAEKNHDHLNSVGFILTSQNKNPVSFPKTGISPALNASRISDTRYWIQVPSKSTSYIVLSKTFYPNWKLLGGVDKNMLNGSFIHNLELLTKSAVPEKQHFVVNGYANLWEVDGNETQYAAIFIPQLITEIGYQITVPSIGVMCIIVLGWIIKKILKRNKNRVEKIK